MRVGTVIAGDFFGWNFGLAAGAFGSMPIAISVMTAMYLGLCFSIVEISPAPPRAVALIPSRGPSRAVRPDFARQPRH